VFKPNFKYRPGCGRRLRSTKPVKTGYQEGIRENDNCLYSEVRNLQESGLATLDQDSRDFLGAVEGKSEGVDIHQTEQTAEERFADGAPSTKIAAEPGVEVDPEVRITIAIPILPGITFSPAPGSKFAKGFLSNRQMMQRLSHEQRLIFKFAKMVHPKIGNMSVDAAAAKTRLRRDVARAWAIILRNVLGDAEFEKADITKAREAKRRHEMALLQSIAAMPGPRYAGAEVTPDSPATAKPLPAHYQVYRGGHFVRQSQQRVPRAATYPPDGMVNF
jgi:hypothetical protein